MLVDPNFYNRTLGLLNPHCSGVRLFLIDTTVDTGKKRLGDMQSVRGDDYAGSGESNDNAAAYPQAEPQ